MHLWRLTDVHLRTSMYAVAEARKNLLLSRPEAVARLDELLQGVESHAADRPNTGPPAEFAGLPPTDLPIVRDALGARAHYLLTGDRRHFGDFFGRKISGLIIMMPGDYPAMKTGRKRKGGKR